MVYIKLQTKFELSNFGSIYSSQEDLMLLPIGVDILVDFSGNLTEEEFLQKEANGEEFFTKVGQIFCHRFDLRFSPENLWYAADAFHADLEKVASFFFSEEGQEILEEIMLFPSTIFYIDEVFILPKYRGKNYGLLGLGLFLELVAWGQIVACIPKPIEEYKAKYSEDKGKLLLRKYWSKLGLKHYDKEFNILWEPDWSIPKWLKDKIFQY
jgi:hypothetical protein